MADNSTTEIVRAINRNTEELRRITAELKRQSQHPALTSYDADLDELGKVLRLTEPAAQPTHGGFPTFGDEDG